MSITQAQCVIAAQGGFDFDFGVDVLSAGRGFSITSPVGGSMDPSTYLGEIFRLARATQNADPTSWQLQFTDDPFTQLTQPGGATVIRSIIEGYGEVDATWNGSSYIASEPQALWTYLDSVVGQVIGLTLENIA